MDAGVQRDIGWGLQGNSQLSLGSLSGALVVSKPPLDITLDSGLQRNHAGGVGIVKKCPKRNVTTYKVFARRDEENSSRGRMELG